MASGIAVIGIDPTRVDVGQPAFSLNAVGGVDALDGTGTKTYVYVKATASTAYTAGQVVQIDDAGAIVPATLTTSAPGTGKGRRAGVVVAPMAPTTTPQYGWVQRGGVGNVLALASCAKDTLLNTTATAGALDDDEGAGSERITGIALKTAVGAGGAAVGVAVIDHPEVAQTL